MIEKESVLGVFLLGGLLAFGFIGARDLEDEIAEQEFYCEQVLAGHWPDYKEIAEEACVAVDD